MKLPSVGIRLPRLGASPLVSQWLVAMLLCSVASWFDGGWIESRFALIPSRVWLGDVWRLGTWIFIEPAPLLLVLSCLAIFKLGTDLSGEWRDAGLQRICVRVVLGAGVATTLIATFVDDSRMVRVAGWAVVDLLVILWARYFAARADKRIIPATVGVTVVFAVVLGPLRMMPELAACAIAALYPLPRRR